MKKRRTTIWIALCTAAVCAVLAILLFTAVLPSIRFRRAKALFEAGQYEEAITTLESLNGYGDSETLILECRYAMAMDLTASGRYEEAAAAFEAMDGYQDSTERARAAYVSYEIAQISEAKVGDYVVFGAYEQDNDASNGKEAVEWQVLEKDGDSALLISRYALDCKPYHTPYVDVTWEDCSLRAWLNGPFMDDAFSENEQDRIAYTVVTSERNPRYPKTPAGSDTEDRVFLLGMAEVDRFLGSADAGQCQPTAYANAQSAYADITTGNGNCLWWLRSPGIRPNAAAFVDSTGNISFHGYSVDHANTAVRPVIRIDTGSR